MKTKKAAFAAWKKKCFEDEHLKYLWTKMKLVHFQSHNEQKIEGDAWPFF